jgi:FkbM family methyltransferase
MKSIVRKLLVTRRFFRRCAGLKSGYRFTREFFREFDTPDGTETEISLNDNGRVLELRPRCRCTDTASAKEVFFDGLYQLPPGWKPKVIWDVGGNAGLVTLFYAARYPDAVIHTFEPVPANAARIRKHVEANKLTNVHVHEYGLSDADGTLEFASSAPGRFWDFSASNTEGANKMTVPMRNVADVMRELSPDGVCLMKIDIEGGERAVLPALRPWLPKMPWIIGELHDTSAEWLPCLNLLAESHRLDLSKGLHQRTLMFCAALDEQSLTEWTGVLRNPIA